MNLEEVIDEIEETAATAVFESHTDPAQRVGFDDAAHDIAVSYLHLVPPEVARDIARCYLGWDPVHDADLYAREGIL